jgi:hypothetical protein
MNFKFPRGRFLPLFCLAALLAAGLLSARPSSAQAAAPDKSSAQAPSAAPDKSGAEDKPDKPDKKDQKSDPGMVKFKVVITNASGKPVANASVYVKYNESGGLFHHDKLAEMSFKTNEDGSVKTPEVPQGKILIQVIAKGWHTFGKWYDIDTDGQTIEIKLEPPPHWY